MEQHIFRRHMAARVSMGHSGRIKVGILDTLNYEPATPPLRGFNVDEYGVRRLALFGSKIAERRTALWLDNVVNRVPTFSGVVKVVRACLGYLHVCLNIKQLRSLDFVYVLGHRRQRLLKRLSSFGLLGRLGVAHIVYSTRDKDTSFRDSDRNGDAGTSLVFLSSQQVDEVRALQPQCRCFRLVYGVDTDFWRFTKGVLPIGLERGYILCVGEAGRDEALFLEVVRHVDARFVRVLNSRRALKVYSETISGDRLIGNRLKILTGLCAEDLRLVYSGAHLTFLPLRQEKEPWGLTVLLESLACGTPVVTNHDYTLSALIPEELRFVTKIQPGVAAALAFFEGYRGWASRLTGFHPHLTEKRSLASTADQLQLFALEALGRNRDSYAATLASGHTYENAPMVPFVQQNDKTRTDQPGS